MKLRKIFSYILLAALPVIAGGCSDDIDSPDNPDVIGEGNVTLTFRSAKNNSRAADDNFNENVINSLHVFLYTADADPDTSVPVAYKAFSGLTAKTVATVKMQLTKTETKQLFPNGDGDECRLVAIANLQGTTALPSPMTITALRNLAAGSSFKTQRGDNTQPRFIMFGDTDEGRAGTVKVKYTADDFGGSATGNVILVRAAARISLNIRVPETITVKEVTGNDTINVIWTSQASGMEVMLDNGVFQSAVDPSVLTVRPANDDYFNLEAGSLFKFTDSGETDATAYRWKQSRPFYTYPNQWESSPGETHKTTMTLIVPWRRQGTDTYRTCYYKVPVTGGTELLRNTAYTVNLNVGMLGSFIKEKPFEVEPTYLTVDWADVETGVDIKDYRYLVVNQNTYTVDNQPTVSIPFYSSHEVEIESITMTYQRFNMYGNNSEPIDIDITAEQNHLTGLKNEGDSLYSYQLTSDAMGNNVLTINHPLSTWEPYDSNDQAVPETNYTSETAAKDSLQYISYYKPADGMAFSPYVITVKIKHKDMESGSAFEQTLTVTQNPGMFIKADKNPYAPATGPGYVYVNNFQASGNTSSQGLGNVNGISNSANNRNPNMYVITINTLDSVQQKYIIDDPRYYIPINLGNNSWTETTGTGWWAQTTTYYYLTGTTSLNDPIANIVPGSTAATELAKSPYESNGNGNNRWYWSARTPSIYTVNADGEISLSNTNTTRSLSNYYPTNEGDDFANVIAPKIRVASSYGVTTTLTRNLARRRCASYQEAGRPAGRWRLPTLGELEFIVNLSRTGKIPTLFSTGDGYWSAQGYVSIPAASDSNVTLTATSSNSATRAVRCVYDEWFWERFLPASNNTTANYYSTFIWGDRPKDNPEGTN